MKTFVPYHDGLLEELLPDDRLVPYQAEWRDYLNPTTTGKQAGIKAPDSTPSNHRSVRPTVEPNHR